MTVPGTKSILSPLYRGRLAPSPTGYRDSYNGAMITAAIASEVELSGFAVIEEVLSTREVEGLKDALDQIAPNRSVLKRGGVFAVRNLLDVSAVRELANSSAIRELVEPVLGPHCVPVRGILFDKIPDANW